MVLLPTTPGSSNAAAVAAAVVVDARAGVEVEEDVLQKIDALRSASIPVAPQSRGRNTKQREGTAAKAEAERRRRESAARKSGKEEAESAAQAVQAQRDAQVQESYAAATKIQAGARGAIARRVARERMAKIELSKDEKTVRMVENVFRTVRQHLKSDRKLYGKALADAAEAFRVMDKDKSGALSEAEFSEALMRMGLGLTQEQVSAVVRFVDADGDGEILYGEYMALLVKGDPELANTEEAHVLEERRREAREKRKMKRKAAAKKSAQMRKGHALGQTIMRADERVAHLEAKKSEQQLQEQPRTESDVGGTQVELADQPVQFGEGNWMPHQHSFDEETSGFGFDVEPEAPKEPERPPASFTKHHSWRGWCQANISEAASMLVPSRRTTNNDTAEVKLLKDKFKALVYGRSKDPAMLLFRKFDPNGDGALDLQEFTEAVRRNWKGKAAPLTRKQILNLFNACDVDGSGEIDMVELAEFVWGEQSPEAIKAQALMRSGRWMSPSPRMSGTEATVGIEYLKLAAVAPDADGPVPTLKETMQLRSKLKQASYTRGGQNPAELFRRFDTDGSGELNMAEFIMAIRKGGQMSKDQMSDRDIRRLFRLIDADGGGEISIKELTDYVWGEQGFTQQGRDNKDNIIPSESFATVRQAFFGTSQEQLNVARGDQVTIKEQKGVWCTVRDHSTGRVGLVPTAYINQAPKPGTKKSSKAAVLARLTQQSHKEADTGLLLSGDSQARGNKEYWRTIAVPLEAHVAAARKGLIVPDVLHGAREFFSTHEDMHERLVKPTPARGKKLSQLATPKGGTAALARIRAEAQARHKDFDSVDGSKTPKVPQPPSARKPVLGTPLSCRAKPSPRRLRSLKGSKSARAATESARSANERQRPQEFGADTYVGHATVKSLRTQVIERKVNDPCEATVELRSAEELARRLNERDVYMAQQAAERKLKLEEDQFATQFDAQLMAAKRELHYKRLKEEQDCARRSLHEAKRVAQQEAAAKRQAKVQKRKEEAEKERVEYNRAKAARAKAKAEEELAEKMRQLEDRQQARDELNAHIAKEQERRASKHRGAFGAVPEGWRSLKENEKAFRKVKSEAKRLVEQEQELARKVGPIRQRKMAALHHEFNVVPTATGAYPRHTIPELAYALDTIAKGDLRMAVAYLTEEGAPTWGATTIQARVRGNRSREELKRRHAAAVNIQTRARSIQGRVRGVQYMIEVRAARRIQARRRGNLQRHHLEQQHAAALKLQTSQRGRAARAEKVRRRENRHATVLQQVCRRQLARRQLQKQTTAAQRVQRVFRGWRLRRIIVALKAEIDKYTVLKKVTAQCAADEKSKKVPSSEGSVFLPGERVMDTIESKSVLLKGSDVRVQRIKVNLSSGSQGWLSVSDKKGTALMERIHRWLVREKSVTHVATGGKRQVMEGKLRWKYAEEPHADAV